MRFAGLSTLSCLMQIVQLVAVRKSASTSSVVFLLRGNANTSQLQSNMLTSSGKDSQRMENSVADGTTIKFSDRISFSLQSARESAHIEFVFLVVVSLMDDFLMAENCAGFHETLNVRD